MGKTEADYLEELVAFPSVSSDKEVSVKCAQFCAEFFKKNNLHTDVIKSNGYPNVVAFSQQTKTPKVLLQCHMDVVPAKDELFAMKRTGNKLAGRGTFDMKFACASYMRLASELADTADKYDFGIMLSFDEEIGGHNGVEALLNQGYGADICILPDSGKDWRLESSAHGAWFFKLTKSGKSAHGSIPEKGINAAEILTRAIADIHALRQEYPAGELSLSLTQLKSGKAINQIPGHAEAVFDIRFKNKEIRSSLADRLEKIRQKYKLDIKTIVLADCMSIDTRADGVAEFIGIAEEILGRKIPADHSFGATDARYFCAKNIPCIVIQPNGGGRHSDTEWVDAKGVEDLTAILLKFIRRYAII